MHKMINGINDNNKNNCSYNVAAPPKSTATYRRLRKNRVYDSFTFNLCFTVTLIKQTNNNLIKLRATNLNEWFIEISILVLLTCFNVRLFICLFVLFFCIVQFDFIFFWLPLQVDKCGRFFYHLLPLGQPFLRPFKKINSLTWNEHTKKKKLPKHPWNAREKITLAHKLCRVQRGCNVYYTEWESPFKWTTSPFSVWMINMFTFFSSVVSLCFVCACGEWYCAFTCVRNTIHNTARHSILGMWVSECVCYINNPSFNYYFRILYESVYPIFIYCKLYIAYACVWVCG